MSVTIIGGISEICAQEWNLLIDDTNPFIRHEFLAALEKHNCVGQHFGWIPQHITLRNEQNKLIGAVPLYLKDNSYGEFVFDWAWAEAYHRGGLEYYPKLVAAVPYTPATGPRLLLHPEARADNQAIDTLISAALTHARHLKVSSLHWLFPHKTDTATLQARGFMPRLGCQFHWNNPGYANFDEFLATLTAAKRKKIRRERRHVAEAGVRLETLSGGEISDSQWSTYYRYYVSTFEKLGGHATLSEDFFRELGQSMPDNVVMVMAMHNNKAIAAAFSLRGQHTLYGRHWGCERGCEREYNSLHFEACYYQGIDYCIKHKLQRFEPGAQGEHKISRGFLPQATYSTHWIANDTFQEAIANFLSYETKEMQQYINDLQTHSPYKNQAN